MKNIPNAIRTKYKSEFSDPKRALRAYFLVALFDLVIFGFFGLHLALVSLGEKGQQLVELKKETASLQEKLENLQEAAGALKAIEPFKKAINDAIPYDSNIQGYLVDAVKVTSFNGFNIENFIPTQTDASTMKIQMSLSGDLSNITALISQIEKLSRLTVVKSFAVFFTNQFNNVALEVDVYNSPNVPLDFTQPFNAKIDIDYISKEFKAANE
jgi:Tfp pilus assembly protein PilO